MNFLAFFKTVCWGKSGKLDTFYRQTVLSSGSQSTNFLSIKWESVYNCLSWFISCLLGCWQANSFLFTRERKLVYFEPRTNTKVWILWIPIGFSWRCIIRYEFRKTRAACDKITHSAEEKQPKSWHYSLIALEDVSKMIHFLQNCGERVQIDPLFAIFWKMLKFIHFLKYFGKCEERTAWTSKTKCCQHLDYKLIHLFWHLEKI